MPGDSAFNPAITPSEPALDYLNGPHNEPSGVFPGHYLFVRSPITFPGAAYVTAGAQVFAAKVYSGIARLQDRTGVPGRQMIISQRRTSGRPGR